MGFFCCFFFQGWQVQQEKEIEGGYYLRVSLFWLQQEVVWFHQMGFIRKSQNLLLACLGWFHSTTLYDRIMRR